ncbi:MAG TPA: phenylalanine--tRNA ligase subunit beta [Vicinamibacterales bacterium]|nr:phenylalanine--tRNA ligase subunit beta [Vicinamibacterales bacterium]
MRILLSWLRDFVDVPADARALAERLAMRGFETASVEPIALPAVPPWAAPAADDAVIDFEITANRPDCLSLLGMAREAGTAYDRPLRPLGEAPGLDRMALPAGESDAVSVTLDAPDLCPRYAAAAADVRVGPSPAWLALRLEAAGVRPISNVVDITNYVLLELGHPTHAFDLDRLGGRALRIRRARPGEMLVTLDGVSRTLADDMLVIADADRAQAVAGVMGGAAAEVSSATRRVVFESAYFTPTSVRRTSKRLGLMTEASARFERGADINAPLLALERIGALLRLIGAGTIVGHVVDRYPAPRGPVTIRLRRARLASLLGVQVADGEVERIFRGLGLDAARLADGWDVTAPTFRVDLRREADLVEEVGRHYGYDRLPAVFPVPAAPPAPDDPRVSRDRLVRRVLLAAGLSEAMTYAFIEQRAHEAFGLADQDVVPIANPLSASFEVLRRSLLPGLVEAVARNRHHQQRDVRLFELGARFSATDGETRGVAVAWTGAAADGHWSGTGRDVDFFDVKGLVERLADVLRLPVRVAPIAHPALVPGRAGALLVEAASASHGQIGLLGQLQPAIAESRGLPGADPVYVAEIDLDAAWEAGLQIDLAGATRGAGAIEPLPRFPSVLRDISLLVDASLPASTVRGTIHAHAPGWLAGVTFFDRYQGKGIPEGRVSLSVRLTFRSPERTLTDAEVQEAAEAIVAALVREHGVVQR